MKQVYDCYIKVLSPLHIGCDEVYEPTGFVVDETKGTLTAFDPIGFISEMSLTDKARFSEICKKGTVESILEVYKFLRRKTARGKTVALCKGFVSHYNKTLSISSTDRKRIQSDLNSFTISRTSFLSQDERPYIPGSAIKGAVRTAYLNHENRLQRLETPDGKNAAKDLEKKLLSYSDFSADPFRLVKVSDFMPVGAVETRIMYAVDIKKSSGDIARGPFQILETIIPGAILRGQITVEEPLSQKIIKKPVQLQTLLGSIRIFFSKEFRKETEQLNAVGISTTSEMSDPSAIPIRVGRHSGAECVTIEGHRDIKIMGGKGKKDKWEDHATTIWLAGDESKPNFIKNYKPFGWAELFPLDPVMEKEFDEKENHWASMITGVNLTEISETEIDSLKIEKLSQPIHEERKKEPDPEIWEKVVLSYAPNTQTYSTRNSEGKTAETKDKTLVPAELLEKITKKKKAVVVSLKVIPIGGKTYHIIEIMENINK